MKRCNASAVNWQNGSGKQPVNNKNYKVVSSKNASSDAFFLP